MVDFALPPVVRFFFFFDFPRSVSIRTPWYRSFFFVFGFLRVVVSTHARLFIRTFAASASLPTHFFSCMCCAFGLLLVPVPLDTSFDPFVRTSSIFLLSFRGSFGSTLHDLGGSLPPSPSPFFFLFPSFPFVGRLSVVSDPRLVVVARVVVPPHRHTPPPRHRVHRWDVWCRVDRTLTWSTMSVSHHGASCHSRWKERIATKAPTEPNRRQKEEQRGWDVWMHGRRAMHHGG